MKKDFSQPFELSDKMDVGVIVEIPDYFQENRFVLSKVHLELPVDEYLPLSLEVNAKGQTVSEIAKFLHERGLILSTLREIVAEQSVEFALIDDASGIIDKEVYYYACADLATMRDDLLYVSFDKFREYVLGASLAQSIDIAAVNMLAIQRRTS